MIRLVVISLLGLSIVGCASFNPNPELADHLERVQTQSQGGVEVSTSVLSRDEAEELFGVDLAFKQIQPVWVDVKNRDSHPYWLVSSGLDPEYFSPREVAYSYRRWLGGSYNDEIESFFLQQSFKNPIPPNTEHSGFIFVNLDEDEKEIDIDLISKEETKFFDFFVDLSDLHASSLQTAEQRYPVAGRETLSETELRQLLRRLPCCTTSESGEVNGDPLNLVLIGNSRHLFPPFVRRGWHYSEDNYLGSIWKTVNSFLFGKHYRYSPVSPLYYEGRSQDIALQKARGTIHQRNHLRLWLTDYLFNGKEVWVGQISRDIGVRFTWHTPTFTTHKIDPDIDEARTAFIEDMLFSQGLMRIGFEEGVGARTLADPGQNLTGDEYYTDGLRAVLEFESRPSNIEDVRFFDWAVPPSRQFFAN